MDRMRGTPNLQLYDALQFRLSRKKEIEDFFDEDEQHIQ